MWFNTQHKFLLRAVEYFKYVYLTFALLFFPDVLKRLQPMVARCLTLRRARPQSTHSSRCRVSVCRHTMYFTSKLVTEVHGFVKMEAWAVFT